MNREEIIRMAREAGFEFPADYDLTEPISRLERFAALVAAAEREACAVELKKSSEPVAWMHTNGVGHVYFRKKPQDKVFNPRPVYLKDE